MAGSGSGELCAASDSTGEAIFFDFFPLTAETPSPSTARFLLTDDFVDSDMVEF